MSAAPLENDLGQRLVRSLRALEKANARVQTLERRQREPIAIVAMACRFPGGVRDPAGFFELLVSGRDGVEDLSRRWPIADFYDPNPEAPGKMYTRRGGLIDDIESFDCGFFGIAPREALYMDPQQRVLLETAWEALERAGLAGTTATVRGGVFVGIGASEYAPLYQASAEAASLDGYLATGCATSVAAGRLSYVLGWQGPSLVVDTACSSSLVAVHLAMQSLRAHECDVALAGGVNLMLSPLSTVVICRNRMLSADGRCKTFDASADGYVRSEGCGLVLLKRLGDALRDGDHIHAVLRGSAINQDGRSQGMTAPNGPAQEAVIRAALDAADVSPETVDYVEAHGTGTSLGDPLEFQVLDAVYGAAHTPERPVWIGAVKSNIGHAEAAAGVAGLIKSVLALEHGRLPPNLHFTRANPLLGLPDDTHPSRLRLCTKIERWRDGTTPRRAAVSSFGFSGTNAHVILEQAPARAPASGASSRERSRHLLALSARSAEALGQLREAFRETLTRSDDTALADICFSANAGRKHFPQCRVAVSGTGTTEMAQALARASTRSTPESESAPSIAFLFSGQGAQYAGMATELYDESPVFRSEFDRLAAAVRAESGIVLQDLLRAPIANMTRTENLQPLLYVLQMALARQWMKWGVVPAIVVGHSVGEYAAAAVAGVFDAETGARLVATRARLMQELCEPGAMLAVTAEPEALASILREEMLDVDIAAHNGPNRSVVAGSATDIERAERCFAARGLIGQRLAVSHAFHSKWMEPLLPRFGETLARVTWHRPTVPMVSTLTGSLATNELTDPNYWLAQVRRPVAFAAALRACAEPAPKIYLEIGPGRTLLAFQQATVSTSDEVARLASLRLGASDWQTVLDSLAELYMRGVAIDWNAFDAPWQRRKLPLPTYPFERRRLWAPASWNPTARPRSHAADDSMRVIRSALRDEFTVECTLADCPVVHAADHRVLDKVVVPGAAHVAMLVAVARKCLGFDSYTLSDVSFPTALVPEADDAHFMQYVIEPERNGLRRCSAHGRAGAAPEWTLHMECDLAADSPLSAPTAGAAPASRDDTATTVFDAHTFYKRLGDAGFALGPSFRWIDELRSGVGWSRARLRRPESDSAGVSASLIDACFQCATCALPADSAISTANDIYLPIGVAAVRIFRDPPSDLWCEARLAGTEGHAREMFVHDLYLTDRDGAPIAELRGFRSRRVPRTTLAAQWSANGGDFFYDLAWDPAPRSGAGRKVDGTWLVYGTDQSEIDRTAESLRAAGAECHVLPSHTNIEPLPAPADGWRGLIWLAYGNGDPVPADVESRCAEALSLIQVMRNAPRRPDFEFWIATRGSVRAEPGDKLTDLSGAALWGFARTAQLEAPELRVILVDSPSAGTAQLDPLADEILHNDGEPQVALRAQRRAARLVRSTDDAPTRAETTTHGSVLITGGLGDLGLACAAHLAARGFRDFVLVSRGDASADARQRIDRLRSLGARVRIEHGDVASESFVRRLIDDLSDNDPPLAGIIHAAGVIKDRVLADMTSADLHEVLAPKVHGAWHLHGALRNRPLAFFVLFSSAASVFGSPAQASYAAANAFLDGLAHHRRALGFTATSIAWGPWSDIGMAARTGAAAARRLGLSALAPADALRCLDDVLASDTAHRAVMAVDWSVVGRTLARFGQLPPLLSAFRRDMSGVGSGEFERRVLDLRAELAVAAREPRRRLLESFVHQEVARVMGLSLDEIDAGQPLQTLGLDSLMAVELRNVLAAALERRLPATLLFDQPSVASLAAFLAEEIGPDREETNTAVADGLDGLGVDDLERLLREELSRT